MSILIALGEPDLYSSSKAPWLSLLSCISLAHTCPPDWHKNGAKLCLGSRRRFKYSLPSTNLWSQWVLGPPLDRCRQALSNWLKASSTGSSGGFPAPACQELPPWGCSLSPSGSPVVQQAHIAEGECEFLHVRPTAAPPTLQQNLGKGLGFAREVCLWTVLPFLSWDLRLQKEAWTEVEFGQWGWKEQKCLPWGRRNLVCYSTFAGKIHTHKAY